MSSIAGLIDIRPQNHVAYSTAKAGVIQLSKVLASEWAGHNVRVNAIAPGYVATDMTRSVAQNQLLETWKSLIPTGRLMSADEIGYAVLFLASPASSSVTGQVLIADFRLHGMVRSRDGKLPAENSLHLQPEIDGLEAFGRRQNVGPADNLSFADRPFQHDAMRKPDRQGVQRQ